MDNTNPIERLMEFGMGISMARQMTEMMNSTMQNMQVPGQHISQSKQKDWFVAFNKEASGPYSEDEIKSLLLSKKLTRDDLVWTSGMPAWKNAKDVPEIVKIITQLPPSL